jgi:hypothetical protein
MEPQEEEDDFKTIPHRMLKTAEEVLYQTLDVKTAHDHLWLGEYYHYLGSLPYDLTYNAYCVVCAAYNALNMVFGNEPFHRVFWEPHPVDETTTDTRLQPEKSDVASAAVQAYAAIDENEPGVWCSDSKPYKPITFDSQKRLAFWEWWLTEAIPIAWESATANA